jgi:TatA/E family protein of Tat protein translocase
VEIAILVGLIILMFGAKKLPEIGSGMGRGLRDFKRGLLGDDSDDDDGGAPDDVSEVRDHDDPGTG